MGKSAPRILIEVNHQWCQRLPLRENILICITCGQTKPIRAPVDGIMPCAELRAWQTSGARASGDFMSVPLRPAAKLKASGQHDEAAPLTAVAGMIMAGFAEKEGKG